MKFQNVCLLAALTLVIMPVFAAAAPCGIDVYGLEVINSKIYANIHNTGEETQTVSYELITDLYTIGSGQAGINPGDTYNFQMNYAFSSGDHELWFRANSTSVEDNVTCHASDFMKNYYTSLRPMERCVEPFGNGGDIRCDTGLRNLMYCNGSAWHVYSEYPFQYCDQCNHCGDGVCNCWEEESCPADCAGVGTGSCGVEITDTDYQSEVQYNETIKVLVKFRNTASASETVTLRLFSNNTLINSTTHPNILPGQSREQDIRFKLSKGTYNMRVEASTNCSSVFDSKTMQIIVLKPENRSVNYPPEHPPVTSINVFPSSLDIELYKSGLVTVNVESSVFQRLTVKVTGIDPSWVKNDQFIELQMKNDGTYANDGFIYVTPQITGSHSMLVSVTGPLMNATSNVSIYVALPQNETSDSEPAPVPLFLVVAVAAAAAAVIIYFGIKKLRHELEED